MKKRTIITIITIIFGIIFCIVLFGFLCFGLLLTLVQIENDQFNNYIKDAKWNITREQFHEKGYENLKDKMTASFRDEDFDVIISSEVFYSESHIYMFKMSNEHFETSVRIEVFIENALFSMETNFWGEEFNEEFYSTILLKYDKVISKFASDYLFDCNIDESILRDIYNKSGYCGRIITYEDSAFGTIGHSCAIFDNDIDGKRRIFEFDIKYFMTNGLAFIS